MAVFTVFEPPRPASNPAGRPAAERAERFVFIRDGFSWGAFLFGPLWMLYRRLWLVLLAYVVVLAAVYFGLRAAGVGPDSRMLVGILIALLIGFEAPTLRRFTLVRRGWRELATVTGDDIEEAERRFFDAWVAGATERAPAPAAATIIAPSPYRQDVIGLFPEPGGGR